MNLLRTVETLTKRTAVNYSLLQFKTMVLWNFDLQWKNYGTMENNYGTLEKNYGTMEKL